MKKIFVKILVGVCVVCVGAIQQSCQKDDFGYEEGAAMDDEMEMIVLEHLELDNDQYILHLTQSEALELGISEQDFALIQQGLK